MRPLKLFRLIVFVTIAAALPVLGAIAAYAQSPQATHRLLDDPNLNGPAPMAGQNVVTTDGQRIGAVTAVEASPGGHVKAMFFATGGFWGFGRRTVAVPAGRFAVTGQDVYINFSARDVERLPDMAAGQG
jgi:hypothetical protein